VEEHVEYRLSTYYGFKLVSNNQFRKIYFHHSDVYTCNTCCGHITWQSFQTARVELLLM